MLFGLVLLLATSLLLCFSRSIELLLIGRFLQGSSAGMVWSVGMALVIDSVGSNNIGQAMGWVGSAGSMGNIVGPLLGGVVYAKAGYYAVFVMCFALIVVDILLRLSIIEPKDARTWLEDDTQDREREPLVGGTNDSNAEAVNREEPDATSPNTIIAGEQLSDLPRPVLIRLLTKPRLLAAFCGTVIEANIQTSFDSTLPLFVASTFGWDATGAGLVFLPLVLPMLLGPLAGAVADRYGPKWPATLGHLNCVPLLICLRFVTDNTLAHQILLCVLLSAIGLSTTFVFGPLMGEISWCLQEDSEDPSVEPYALAYGLYTMSFSIGAMLGPVLGGMVRNAYGWPAVGLALASASLVAAVVQALWTGGPLKLRTSHTVET